MGGWAREFRDRRGSSGGRIPTKWILLALLVGAAGAALLLQHKAFEPVVIFPAPVTFYVWTPGA